MDPERSPTCFPIFGGQNCVIPLQNSLLHVMSTKPKIPHPKLLVCCTHFQFSHQDSLSVAWILLLSFIFHRVLILFCVYVHLLTKYKKQILCSTGKELPITNQVALLFYQSIIRYFSISFFYIYNRDPRFTSDFCQSLWKLLCLHSIAILAHNHHVVFPNDHI